MSESQTTPPFLAWALEQSCPLRNIDRWQEPERTERHLRAVVEFARGVGEGRVADGVCLGAECLREETPLVECSGFKVDEALAMFGGREFIQQTCGACPANVAMPFDQSPALAGCHGILPLPHLANWTVDAREAWYRQTATSPWVRGNMDSIQAFSLISGQLFDKTPVCEQFDFMAALDCCERHSLPLHVRMFSAGRIEGRRWILPPMCVACGAEWEGDAQCRWCSSTISSGGEVKRHMRGRRPFQPLSRFLSPEEAERRVANLRAEQESLRAATRERYQQSLKQANN